jgi:hypothetical protein
MGPVNAPFPSSTVDDSVATYFLLHELPRACGCLALNVEI